MEFQKAIGLIAPLQDEISPFVKALKSPLRRGGFFEGQLGGRKVLLGKMGVGKKGIETLCRDFPLEDVEGIIFIGCAGALQEGIGAGELFLCKPDFFWDGEKIHHQSFRYNRSWEEKVKEISTSFPEGLTVTSSSILRNPEEKKNLGALSGGALIEMEYFYVPEFLQSFHGPLLFLRVILDSLEKPLPDLGDFSERDRPPLSSLIKNFFLHPLGMLYLAKTFPWAIKKLKQQVMEILTAL